MWAVALLLLMALGALTFRIRGGLLEDYHVPGQLSRLSWATACAAAAWAGSPLDAWPAVLAVGVLVWLASMAGLHHTIDMGHNEDSFLRDFAVGHLHGLLLGAAAALPMAWAAWGCPGLSCGLGAFPRWWLPLIGGAAWGLCYALAWLRRDWPELRSSQLGKFGNPPEVAELLFGAEFAASLFFAS